jgi:tripartite-type tricarboxylate transporter receptor subunit TctC
VPNVLLIHSGLPIDNVKDLVRISREKPRGITFGANGGSNLISAEIFQHKNKLSWLHVPYKGSALALRATMSGETDLIFIASNLANQAVETGKVKALAVAYPRRLGYLPGVPTMKEAGFNGVESSQWYGILAPDGTPQHIIDVIERVIKDDLERNGKLQKYLQGNHLETAFLGKQDFKKFMLDETQRIKRLNIEISN